MSNNLIIKPEELREEANSYSSSAKAVGAVSCTLAAGKTDVSSFQQFAAAFESFKTLIADFSALSEKDANNLLLIRSEWMRLDTTLSQNMQGHGGGGGSF